MNYSLVILPKREQQKMKKRKTDNKVNAYQQQRKSSVIVMFLYHRLHFLKRRNTKVRLGFETSSCSFDVLSQPTHAFQNLGGRFGRDNKESEKVIRLYTTLPHAGISTFYLILSISDSILLHFRKTVMVALLFYPSIFFNPRFNCGFINPQFL